jgi:thiol:disulfide interchange protein DsbD
MKPPKLLEPASILALLLSLSMQVEAAPAPVAASPPELLEAEQAFQVSARFLDANTLELSYRIADGYYMYRERFKFATEAGNPAAGKARLPAGKIKQDATFGRVETYRKSVRVLLPLTKMGANGAPVDATQLIALLATSQGCADAGVCYPPQQHQFRLARGSTISVLPLAAGSAGFSLGATQGAVGRLAAPASGKISDLIKRAP